MSSTADEQRAPVPHDWDASSIPSLHGKTAIVTGANSGIGYVTALELARKGAHVVLACRSEQKGNDAVEKIRAELASTTTTTTKGSSGAEASAATGTDNTGAGATGDVQFMQLDVSSLASVQAFADRFKQTHTRLDVLVNNAGIMAVPFALSVDGVESQFATNHLGHFALTAQLFGLLKASTPSRVVNISSVMHRYANLTPSAPIVTPEKDYGAIRVYGNSKLCNLLFSAELARRLRASGIDGVSAVTAHPGYTTTNLLGPPGNQRGGLGRAFWGLGDYLALGQSASAGALPTLYAATAPEARSGDFYGPRHLFSLRGKPTLEEPTAASKSEPLGAQLWEESERLAGVQFRV